MTSMMDPVILARESLELRKAAPYHLQVELGPACSSTVHRRSNRTA